MAHVPAPEKQVAASRSKSQQVAAIAAIAALAEGSGIRQIERTTGA